MASASADRTLRLWDLESFEQVCCTPPESGQVRRVLFSDDGGALLSGGEESLKVWGWEPVRCFEQLDVRWSRLTDMCIGPGQKLLGGSVRDAVVSVWSVDMKAMKPFDSMLPEAAPPPQTSARISGAPVSPARSRAVASDAALPAVAAFAQPPPPAAGAYAANAATEATALPAREVAPATPLAGAVDGSSEGDDAAAKCARLQIAQCRAQLAARRVSQGKETGREAGGAASGIGDVSESSSESSLPPPPPERAPVSGHANGRAADAPARGVSVGTSMSDTLMRGEAAAAGQGTEARMAPVAIGARAVPSARASDAAALRAEERVVAELVAQSPRQGVCLVGRLSALRALLDLWEAGDVKKMLQHLNRLEDPSVAVDVVKAGVLKGGRLDLECALVLLPTLDKLLGSTYDDHALAAIEAVSQLVLIFGQLIRNTRAISRDMLGVDLSAEARQQRCQACYEQFSAMLPRLRQLALGSGKLKRAASDAVDALRSELGISG